MLVTRIAKGKEKSGTGKTYATKEKLQTTIRRAQKELDGDAKRCARDEIADIATNSPTC